MKPTTDQQTTIRATIAETFGDAASVWLSGSRVDDNKRGDDIDPLTEPSQTSVAEIVLAVLLLLGKLKMQLWEEKIDVLIDYPTRQIHPVIFSTARQTSIPL